MQEGALMAENFDDVLAALEESARTGQPVDIGDCVLCDDCCTSYTQDHETCGGFLFGTRAIGPCCAERWRAEIERCNETKYIQAECAEGQTFRDFVLSLRAGNNLVYQGPLPH